jgi:type VI protein secretion system component Hcp
MSIYLQIGEMDKDGKMDSRSVMQGTSKDEGHVGWIPVQAFDFSSSDRFELICYRLVDGTSTKLFRMAFYSARPVAIIVEVTNARKQVIQRITYRDAYLSRYSSSPAGNNPSESFTISYLKQTIEYVRYDEKGNPIEQTGRPDSPSYDVGSGANI